MNNFTPRAQQVLALARKEAERLGGVQIGPEHLLLGVFLLPRSNAKKMLENLVIRLEGMRKEIEKAASHQTASSVSAGDSPFTDAYHNSLSLAKTEARRMGHEFVGPEHILLGVLHHGNGASAQIFQDHGVYLESLRNTLLELLRTENNKVAAQKGPTISGVIQYIGWNLIARL